MRHRVSKTGTFSAAFQSTHSLRSATVVTRLARAGFSVSIHALLAECDRRILISLCRIACFNPRTPCGVRRPAQAHGTRSTKFQSTHSLRSATYNTLVLMLYLMCFNPRTPCGVRLTLASKLMDLFQFQSTHSLRSATNAKSEAIEVNLVSIHALLAECDKLRVRFLLFLLMFQSTHSLRSATLTLSPLTWRALCFNPRTPCGVRL